MGVAGYGQDAEEVQDLSYAFPGDWTVGTSYTMTTSRGDYEFSMHYVITEVTDDEVTWEMSPYVNRQPVPGRERTPGSWTSETYESVALPDGVTAAGASIKGETLEIADHSFRCITVEIEDLDTTTSMALDYPGLTVRMTSDAMSLELTEFEAGGAGDSETDADTDPEADADTETDGEQDGDTEIPSFEFPGDWTVGTTYLLHTEVGGISSDARYEITGVTDDEVTYEMTTLFNGAPIAGMDPTVGSFTAEMFTPADDGEPRSSDVSITFEDVEAAGHTFRCMTTALARVTASLALDYPGLSVRMDGRLTVELTEFKLGD